MPTQIKSAPKQRSGVNLMPTLKKYERFFQITNIDVMQEIPNRACLKAIVCGITQTKKMTQIQMVLI